MPRCAVIASTPLRGGCSRKAELLSILDGRGHRIRDTQAKMARHTLYACP